MSCSFPAPSLPVHVLVALLSRCRRSLALRHWSLFCMPEQVLCLKIVYGKADGKALSL